MYAVFKDGGHQVRGSAGETVQIERRATPAGQEIVFDQVLLVGGDQPRVGTPFVPGAKVVAVVAGEARGEKVRGLHTREKDSSQTQFGHRQHYTLVTIKEIVVA